MAVYLITLHAYRSWMPDHRRGFVVRGKGIQPPDVQRARWYHRLARHERMTFDDARCDQIIAAVHDVVKQQGLRLRAVVAVWTHVHVLLSWEGFRSAKRVRAVVKRAISTWLRDCSGEQCKWLAGGGSVKRVYDAPHYRRLTRTYLPSHRKYGGRQWFEHEQPRRGRRG